MQDRADRNVPRVSDADIFPKRVRFVALPPTMLIFFSTVLGASLQLTVRDDEDRRI